MQSVIRRLQRGNSIEIPAATALRPTCRENRCLRVAPSRRARGMGEKGRRFFPPLPSKKHETNHLQARRVAVHRKRLYARNCGSLGSTLCTRIGISRLCCCAVDKNIPHKSRGNIVHAGNGGTDGTTFDASLVYIGRDICDIIDILFALYSTSV